MLQTRQETGDDMMAGPRTDTGEFQVPHGLGPAGMGALVQDIEAVKSAHQLLSQRNEHQYGSLNSKIETVMAEIRTGNEQSSNMMRLMIELQHKGGTLDRLFNEAKAGHGEAGKEVRDVKLAFSELKGAAKMGAFCLAVALGGYFYYANSEFASLHKADERQEHRIDAIPGAPR